MADGRGSAKILLRQGELTITDPLTINGPSASALAIDAQQQSRVIDITATNGNYRISNITLTGGRTTGSNLFLTDCRFSGGAIRCLTSDSITLDHVSITNSETTGYEANGGGIYAAGSLVVSESLITGNRTTGSGASGGGIAIDGDVLVTGSSIDNNYGETNGGGVFSEYGHISLVESSICSNHAPSDGGGIFGRFGAISVIGCVFDGNSGGSGGAIAGRGSGLTLVASTVSGNTAYQGGGVFHIGDLKISDCTISANNAYFMGGGAYAYASGDESASFIRCTITKNTENYSESNPGGGGILVNGNAVVILDHTIVAENMGLRSGKPSDVSGRGIVARHCLIGSNYDAVITDGGGNVIGSPFIRIHPKLGPFAYNGGPTFLDGRQMLTYALLPGSPAIDAGDSAADAASAGVPLYDQRGNPFGRVAGSAIDIGALESQALPSPALPGDYNQNGVVDAADYAVWRDELGFHVAVNSESDGDGNGVVDAGDYQVWMSHFGETIQQGAGSGELGDEAQAALAEPVAPSVLEEETGLPPSASDPRYREAASVAGAGTAVGARNEERGASGEELRILDFGLTSASSVKARIEPSVERDVVSDASSELTTPIQPPAEPGATGGMGLLSLMRGDAPSGLKEKALLAWLAADAGRHFGGPLKQCEGVQFEKTSDAAAENVVGAVDDVFSGVGACAVDAGYWMLDAGIVRGDESEWSRCEMVSCGVRSFLRLRTD